MLALGVLGLLLLWGGGCSLVWSVFKERDLTTVLAQGAAVTAVLTVFFPAVLLRHLSLDASIGVALFLALVALTVALRSGEPASREISLAEAGVVGGLGLFTFLYASFFLSMRQVAEDSFFLHCSNTGLFLADIFPPVNFFGEPLHGHYGQDISVAFLSRLSGVGFLEVEWALRAFLNGLGFPVVYTWLRGECKSRAQAITGAIFLYFGANYCSHIGQFDFLNNNQSVAVLTWLTCCYAVSRALDGKGWWLAAVLLGTDALVYEIHYVMMLGAFITLTAFRVLAPRQSKRARLTVAVSTLVGSLFVAVAVGGPISHQVLSRFTEEVETRKSNPFTQQVSVKFPKDRLFEFRTINLRPSRMFETKLRSWKADFVPSDEYVFALDRRVLNCFWYPVWAAPLTLLWTVWTRCSPAFWLLGLGALGWAVPALVDFGYYEQETFRWLYFTAWCWSTAFGLMVGRLFSMGKGWKRFLVGGGGVLVILFCTAGFWLELKDWKYCWTHAGEPGPDGGPGRVRGVGFFPDPQKSLAHHYNFTEEKWNAALWLKKHAQPDDLYLLDPGRPIRMGEPRPRTVGGEVLNLFGCMMGLSGRLPDAVVPDEVAIFDRSLQSWLFWATLDVKLLESMKSRWLVADEANLPSGGRELLDNDPQLRLVHRERSVSIYEFHSRSLGPREAAPNTAIVAEEPEKLVAPRLNFTWPVKVFAIPENGLWVELRAVGGEQRPNRAPVVRLELMRRSDRLIFSAPALPGDYRFEYRLEGKTEWQALGTLRVEEKASPEERLSERR